MQAQSTRTAERFAIDDRIMLLERIAKESERLIVGRRYPQFAEDNDGLKTLEANHERAVRLYRRLILGG